MSSRSWHPNQPSRDAITRFYGRLGIEPRELSNLMKDLVDEDNELELAAEESEMDSLPGKGRGRSSDHQLVNRSWTDSVKRGGERYFISSLRARDARAGSALTDNSPR